MVFCRPFGQSLKRDKRPLVGLWHQSRNEIEGGGVVAVPGVTKIVRIAVTKGGNIIAVARSGEGAKTRLRERCGINPATHRYSVRVEIQRWSSHPRADGSVGC